MTIHLGEVPASSTLYIPFTTYNSAGASVTMTGLATSDILIYKNGSVTQRSSTSGFTLLDTDGTDFDGVTGLHGISIDLSDNTDAGFYAVGSFYWVVISTVTVDSQTVTLIPATFRICAAESVAGTPKVDVDAFGGSAGTFASGRPEVNTTHWRGTAVATPTTAGVPAVEATSISGNTTAATSLRLQYAAIRSGVSDSGTTTTMVDAALTEADVDYFKGNLIMFTSGNLSNQAREITAFDPVTNTITFTPAVTQSVSTQGYIIVPWARTRLSDIASTVATTAMTEAYSTDGGTVTLAQGIYELLARDQEISISGTTMTVKKRDGTTTAYTLTLNDATSPTSVTRSA